VIGIEWFTLVDQATTGRWFSQYNGESYNTGLLTIYCWASGPRLRGPMRGFE
jgi:hypothetical protein